MCGSIGNDLAKSVKSRQWLAAGCVVLASDVSGSAFDRIENKKNGLIHRAGDINQLAEQLVYIKKDWSQMEQQAKKQKKTSEKWSQENLVKKIKKEVLKIPVL